MSDDSEALPPPPVSAFAFLRKPMFVFGALFLAWIFFGQAAMHFLPHRAETPAAAPAIHEIQANVQQSIKEKDTQITELQRRLDEMESRIKTMQESAAAPAAPADDSGNTAKIAALQASLDALQQTHSAQVGDAAEAAETLKKQEEEITALKAQLADTQAQALRRLSLVAVFGMLKDATLRGEFFAEPLRQMNDLAKGDDAMEELLAQLKPYAASSAPTLSGLQSQFEALVPQALAQDNSNTLARHLQSLIRIRKVGEQQTGNSDEAIIARAEDKLNYGDVEGSLGEMAALSPAATKAFAVWIGKAQALLHIRYALNALQPALLQETTVAAAPAPPPPAPKPAAAQ